MTTERLLALLQLADGLFPAGGFAHSFGLETYVQDGRVRDRADLEAFLIASLEGAVGPGDAAAAAIAARAASAGDRAACREADARLEAMKSVPEFRAASRQMGRQTLRAAVATSGDPLVADFAEAVETGRTPGHHAVAFGLTLGRQGLAPEAVAAAYLHAAAVVLIGAALRLLPLGQLEGQRALAVLRPRLARLAAGAAAAGLDDLWSWAPGLELAGLRHATLEARLFRS
jgi:urease accessory protein